MYNSDKMSMMQISTRGRYAVRAMVDLALHSDGTPVPRQGIAERQGISADYMAHLFRDLQEAGLVASQTGPGGGYRLAKPAEQITVAAILQAVEGPLAVVSCVQVEKSAEMISDEQKRTLRKERSVLPEKENAENSCPLGLFPAKQCVTHQLWRELTSVMRQFLTSVTLEDLCVRARDLN